MTGQFLLRSRYGLCQRQVIKQIGDKTLTPTCSALSPCQEDAENILKEGIAFIHAIGNLVLVYLGIYLKRRLASGEISAGACYGLEENFA